MENAGMFIGKIKSASGNEIIIIGNNIAEQVCMGDKLCLYSGDELIVLRASFPMMTMTKCELVTGERNDIKTGLNVYRYKKIQKEK
jgi:hypothetical protein